MFGLDVRTSRARDLVDAADAVTQRWDRCGLYLSVVCEELCAHLFSVRESVTLNHPDSSELCFLYGTILTDGRTGGPGQARAHLAAVRLIVLHTHTRTSQSPSANICVFADSQVDRSPTGSGVTARMALLAASLDPGMPFAPLWDYLCALEYCDSADTDFSTLTCEFESIVGSRMRGSIHSRVTLADGAQGYRILVSGEGFYTGTSTFTLDVGDELGGGFLVR